MASGFLLGARVICYCQKHYASNDFSICRTARTMNRLYRAVIGLATVLPITIPLAYVFAPQLSRLLPDCWVACLAGVVDVALIMTLVAIVFNAVVGWSFVWFLGYVAHRRGGSPVSVLTVKPLGTDSLLGYMPYVLPFFITQGELQGPVGYGLGLLALMALSWASVAITFSPLLRLCGLYFYEVQLADKSIATLLIRKKQLNPAKIKSAAVISDYCYYGLE